MMAYMIPYEATFKCSEGHQFEAACDFNSKDKEIICPECYAAWIALHVPKAKQISFPVARLPLAVKT